MPIFLKILSAPDEKLVGAKIALDDGPNLIGRAQPPCAVKLDGSKVSKKHCTFHVVNGRVSVEDHNSANGVYVNGRKISNTELKARDRLVIGEFTMEVVV